VEVPVPAVEASATIPTPQLHVSHSAAASTTGSLEGKAVHAHTVPRPSPGAGSVKRASKRVAKEASIAAHTANDISSDRVVTADSSTAAAAIGLDTVNLSILSMNGHAEQPPRLAADNIPPSNTDTLPLTRNGFGSTPRLSFNWPALTGSLAYKELVPEQARAFVKHCWSGVHSPQQIAAVSACSRLWTPHS
jgi:hypothetical protein